MKMVIRPACGFGLQAGFYNVRMRFLSGPGSRITRRRLAALLGVTPLAAQIPTLPATQKTPPVGVPAPPTAAASPDEKLKKANEGIRDVSARLAKLEVSMDTEPAFVFRP
jgi:hypothetical protein